MIDLRIGFPTIFASANTPSYRHKSFNFCCMPNPDRNSRSPSYASHQHKSAPNRKAGGKTEKTENEFCENMEKAFALPQKRNILILKYVSYVCKYRGRQQVYSAAYLHKIAKRWPHCYGWFSSCWDFSASSGSLQRCWWWWWCYNAWTSWIFPRNFDLTFFYFHSIHFTNAYYIICVYEMFIMLAVVIIFIFRILMRKKIGTLMESCGIKQMKQNINNNLKVEHGRSTWMVGGCVCEL